MAGVNSYFLTDEWLNSLIHHTRMEIHGLKKWWLVATKIYTDFTTRVPTK